MANYGVRHRFQRKRLPTVIAGASRTKQSFAAECDINNIMKRFEKDGLVLHVNKFDGQYGDFTNAPEYHDAVNKVLAADDMFMSLPASLRTRFENDPGRFLAFVADPANVREMQSLGLMRRGFALPDDKPAVTSTSTSTST